MKPTQFSHLLQSKLFPVLEEELGEPQCDGPTPDRRLEPDPAAALHSLLARMDGTAVERPRRDRTSLCVKAAYNFDNTRDLLDRLTSDRQLLAICGWKYPQQMPYEATFSRAFAKFAQMQLPQF